MIFLDSSAIIALTNSGDSHHKKAVEVMKKFKKNKECFIITDLVLSEVATVLMLYASLKVAKETVDFLMDSKETEIVPLTRRELEFAAAVFAEQEKPNLSFTDASTIALAQYKKLYAIFTFDKDFKRVKGIRVIP